MMKTFADFIAEAKKSKSDYSKVYAAKVSDARERQQKHVQSHKDKIHQHLEKEKQEAERKEEEEKENQEYIKHIDSLKKEIKDDMKRQYNIKN
jgi:hypothetical protein